MARLDAPSLLVNILKHSCMPSLQVIMGSKSRLWPSWHAARFLFFLFGVRESVSWCLIANRLYLGAILFRCVTASRVHAWGFLHPPQWSWTHSLQMQVWLGMCIPLTSCLRALFANLIRSATVFVACLFSIHHACTFVVSVADDFGYVCLDKGKES